MNSSLAAVTHIIAPSFIRSIIRTLLTSLIALFFGSCVGIFLGIARCYNTQPSVITKAIDYYLTVCRSTPFWGQVLITYMTFPETFSPIFIGAFALGANAVACVADVLNATITNVSEGQWEAAHALGYTKTKALKAIILPQALPSMLPLLLSEITGLFQESSILALTAVETDCYAMNISTKGREAISAYLVVTLIYLSMTSATVCLARCYGKRLVT